MDIPLCSHGGSTETSIFHSIVLVCTLAGPNVFLKPQRIAMYGISCIGFIGCESDQNTDSTAHSASIHRLDEKYAITDDNAGEFSDCPDVLIE